MGDGIGTVGTTAPASNTSNRLQVNKPAQQAGNFQSRKVILASQSDLPMVGASANAPEGASLKSVNARDVSSGVDNTLVEELALGQLTKLGNYLANHAEAGTIPKTLVPDVYTAIEFAQKVDKDMTQVSTLLEKSNHTPLSAAERDEVTALLGSNKHNLSLVQGWLGEKQYQMSAAGESTVEVKTLLQSLQQRFADRHMDLADLISLYDLDEMPAEAVSRSDRIHANLMHAKSAAHLANTLTGHGYDLPKDATARIVAELETLQGRLTDAQKISDDGGRVSALPTGKLTLASQELWDTSFKMVKEKKGDAEAVAQLHSNWDAISRGEAEGPMLPLAHAKIGQARLLREFISHQLTQAGVAKEQMPDLQFLYGLSRSAALNSEQSWEPIVKEVKYQVDGEAQNWDSAESKITPAKAFAKHFEKDYTANGINCADRLLSYEHVPNLAQTQLTGADGKVLFSGLRHGVLDPYGITPKALQKLDSPTLGRMVKDLLIRDSVKEIEPRDYDDDRVFADTDDTVDWVVNKIRAEPKFAAQCADLMRREGANDMAREMAVAALVADPGKFQSALNGETVTLDLSSISLLTPDVVRTLGSSHSNERAMLQNQTAALKGLVQRDPVELTVRDEQGISRKVQVKVNVRTFNFGVNGGAIGKFMHIPSTTPVWRNLMGWGFAMDKNNPELVALVGSSRNETLGGRVEEKLQELQKQKTQLQGALSAAGSAAGSATGDVRESGGSVAETQAQIDSLDKDINKLRDASSQLKDIWRSGSFVSGDREPYKLVSRLALVSHLLGETPLFNCKSGKDRTGQLDSEVKCLAAYAEKQGRLPPPETNIPNLRQMRSQFTLGAGNLEMQKLNTGLPGYKLKWGELPGLANMVAEDGLESAYRGGSDYVAA